MKFNANFKYSVMYKYTWVVVMVSLGLFISCEPVTREQANIDESDTTPPGPVTSPEVENIPGGAIITYENPSDEDLLYVKAEYERNGETVEQKTSVFDNELAIEGFGKSRKVNVELTAVDRNENESESVTVEAVPLDSRIFDIISTVQTVTAFGGIQVTWNNPEEEAIVIRVLAKNESGEWEIAENFYTSSKEGIGTVRGFEPVEREFGVFVLDVWGNVTDTLVTTHMPFPESRVPPEGFIRWNPPGIPYDNWCCSPYAIESMWDGNFDTFFLFNVRGSVWEEFPFIYTFDLGQVVNISRFKFVQRLDIMWANQNVQTFEIWGAASADGLTLDRSSGWQKIGEFEIIKPSGLPVGQLSPDDVAAAEAGHDFSVDPTAPSVRYIRVDVTDKWDDITNCAIAEMQFWGELLGEGEYK